MTDYPKLTAMTCGTHVSSRTEALATDLLSVGEISYLTGIHYSSAGRAMQRGELPNVRLGAHGSRLAPRTDALAWAAKRGE